MKGRWAPRLRSFWSMALLYFYLYSIVSDFYNDLLVENMGFCKSFLPTLVLSEALARGVHLWPMVWNLGVKNHSPWAIWQWIIIIIIITDLYSAFRSEDTEGKLHDLAFISFDSIPVTNRWTDSQTDRHAAHCCFARMHSRCAIKCTYM